MASRFADTTQVRSAGAGRYTGDIDECWNLRPMPQGGVVTTLAIRAMAAELDDASQRLRSLHTSYVGRVAHGPVEIAVEVLRRGRTVSQLRAEVRNPGSEAGHVTTAAFGARRDGHELDLATAPGPVAPPSECRSFRDPPPGEDARWATLPFWTNVEGRLAEGHFVWEEFPPGVAERLGWYRFDQPPMGTDGELDVGALVVLCDAMPGALHEALGSQDPSRPAWFAPSVDLSVHLAEPCCSEWVLAHNTVRWASGGYASGDMELWDLGPDGTDRARLVARATQVFIITIVDDLTPDR